MSETKICEYCGKEYLNIDFCMKKYGTRYCCSKQKKFSLANQAIGWRFVFMEVKKEKAIIVDIDGTIADCRHRRKFLDETPPDWKSFNESCVTDTPNLWCKEIMDKFIGDHTVILVSGRTEEYREVTEEWLKKYEFKFDLLFMRKDGDFISDEIIKEEIYKNFIEPNYEVLFVVDDRSKVVKMWRGLGLTCLHCDEGNY